MRVFKTLGTLACRVERTVGWHAIGMAASAAVVGASLYVLYRLLRHIDAGRVLAAVGATPPESVLAACVFVAAGYVTLTLYDYFALRTIGRADVPYRTAAFASFTSFTIGHNLGATVLTGGAVRLRIYSSWGLGIVDVAKIAFVTGLTFWLGNVFVLSLGLVWAPEAATAVTQLPAWAVQWLGLAGLSALVGYVAWVLPRPRIVGRASWRVVLPNARLTLVQIGIGILDFAAGALAFYALMPATPEISFTAVAVVYVSATLLGFVTHAPGSIGVFDAALLIALAQFEKEELVASLLVFRLVYFVVPFAAAVVMLGVRELMLARNPRGRPAAEQDARSA
ncbi:MAG TPA: YbhN family protein [Hyphomicrobiaceae bacterium]|nr:YbhN family protein [Hyphomicrobiaceae bacterium]